jgi:hypothetical protein
MSTEGSVNLLLQDIEYQTTVTARGIWRRFLYPSGPLYEEFVSHRQVFGMPLLHYTRGICPETGKRRVAMGVIAIGRLAVGIIAIGHASAGIIAIGQAAFGVLLGLGQVSTGVFAIGQLAISLAFALGQAGVGSVVIAQFGFGHYVLAQLGFGVDVWDMRGASPEAQRFFEALLPLAG